MVNPNAKIHYVEYVKDLAYDIELVEGGDRSLSVLAMLRTDRDVAIQKVRDMQDELDELVARANICLRDGDNKYGSCKKCLGPKPYATAPDLCKPCEDAIDKELEAAEKAEIRAGESK